MSGSVPSRKERTSKPAIHTYYDEAQAPATTRLAAEQSVIPGTRPRGPGSLYGTTPQSVRTSLLPGGSDWTDDGSLAGLTDAPSSGAPESVSSSQGVRWNIQNARLLVPDNSGALTPTPLPTFRDPQQNPPVLQCPFNILRCTRHYAMENMDEWFDHSLSHFRGGGRRPRTVSPPTSNQCCFCDKKFENANGLRCWMEKMHHVAWHHHAGHSLSYARPDFELYEYLWQQHIIDAAEYREMGSLAQQPPRSPQNIPTPPDSPSESPLRIVTEINERRNRPA